MSAIGNLVVSIVGDIGQLKKAFAEVGNEVNQLGGKLQSAGKQMASAGKTMSMAVTAPLVGMAALSYKTAVDFDDSMRKVMAVSGATGEEFEQLRSLARELGSTTAFSASEAAEGMQYLAMAGFNVNEILAATDDMLNLASAGAIDLGTAADIASNVLTGFGLQASEAGRVADVLAKAAASSNTDIQQLGEAMSYAAPLAAAMGMSMEEAASLIGKMSDAGIQGSRAGTALRGAMTRLASPTARVANVLEQYNLTLADVDPSTRSFTDILETLSRAGLSTADAMELFGQEAGPGMLALMSIGTDAIREQTLALENAGGAAQEMADIMQGGPGGAARELKSAMEELMIAMGDVVTVGVLPLVKGMTALAQRLSKIPTPVLKIIVVLGAIAAAVGPVLLVVGTLMSGIGGLLTFIGGAGGLTAVVGGLGATLSGVVGVILGPVGIALAALALAAYVIYKNWDKIGPVVKETFNTIKEAATPVIELIKQFVTDALEVFGGWWTDNSPVITAAVSVIASAIMWLIESHIKVLLSVVQAVLPPIISIVSYVVEQIGNFIVLAAQLITGDWAGAWNTAGIIVSTFVDYITGILDGLLGIITGWFDRYDTALEWYLGYYWTRIQNYAAGILNTVTSAGGALWNTVSTVLNSIYSTLSGVLSTIVSFLVNAMSSMLSGWSSGWSNIVAALQNAVNNISSIISSMMSETLNTVSSAGGTMRNIVSNVLNSIYSTLSGVLSSIVSYLVGAMNSMLSGWSSGWNNIVAALQNAVNNIFKALSNAVSTFYNIGAAWIQSLIDGIKSKISSLTSAVSSALSFSSRSSSTSSSSSSSSGSSSSASKSTTSTVTSTLSSVSSALSSAASTAAKAGSSIMSNLARGITSAAPKVTSAVSRVVSRVRNYFPFSPAKEGALKKLPNWDAFFVDPILESTKGLEGVVRSRMSDIAGMVPPITADQSFGAAATASSQTNNIGGNTLIIQNMTLSKDYPFEQFMRDYESRMTRARVQRGIRG
jgi:TP901 family phage tail tape measure protein